jgi:DNA polymerase-1|tara:strand:- start:3405 stop:5096 length:1692 start_codon:yes stop_codon:yes gene_type:complete
MMMKTSTFNKVVLDIETDGLDAKLIHCICVQDYETEEMLDFVQDECYTKFVDFVNENPNRKYIMHNGISFDVPVLNKLLNLKIKFNQIIDTLLLSQMYQSHIDGGHSLKAWGKRLNGEGKIEFDDSFESYSNNMLIYCRADVDLTRRVCKYLATKLKDFSKKSVSLEHKVRSIINWQERNGFYLDQRKANVLVATLTDESEIIKQELQEIFPPITHKRISEKTGNSLKDIIQIFNPGSRKQIAERLISLGWKPKKFTPTKRPIVDEAVLSKIDLTEAKKISRYLLLNKRTSQIKSWLDIVKDNGRVHGKVITLGCVSHRMSHYSPNMAQIPAGYSPYGKECRSCWTIEDQDKYVLIGSDAASLELRCFAHYIDDPDYTQEVVHGDIHTYNQKLAELPDRPTAKTFIYAWLYGAGDAKIGSIVGGGIQRGRQLRERFLNAIPALKRLRHYVDQSAKTGRIKAVDGRYLTVRNQHSALNVLLQGAGSIVCKMWLVNIVRKLRQQNLDARPVANVHDEVQFEVLKEQAEEFGNLTKEAMKDVEKQLDFNCPLDSEYSIGNNWSETH